MDTLIRMSKRIHVHHGELLAVCGEHRYKLCDCKASIEVLEELSPLSMIGGNRVDRRYVTVLVTFDHIPNQIDRGVDLIQFKGDALRSDGIYETIFLPRCLLSSEWDPEMKNTCTFEVQCSIEQLKALLTQF